MYKNGKHVVVSILVLLLFAANAASGQGCLPSPLFEVLDRSPAPGARGVPVTTDISITFGRFAPAIKDYKIEPAVNISNII